MGYDPLTNIPDATRPAGSGDVAVAGRPGDVGDKTNAPDYTCDAYKDMEPFWELCRDVRGGTTTIRKKSSQYLPRFEAESLADYQARVGMTFVNDHYAQTMEDLVGLVCAEDISVDPKLAPAELEPLMDDVDGEGNALPVYARQLLDMALDEGHAGILTDYPDTAALRIELNRELTLADIRERQVRPYWATYRASDILSWRYAKMGSAYVLTKVVLRERVTTNVGDYGSAVVERYRVIEQSAVLSARNQILSLGAIAFQVLEKVAKDGGGTEFRLVDGGKIIGPIRIPLRIVYGGTKLGRLYSRPFLLGLAITNIEEAQVHSDYAAVMHKCNVPTPIFRGRRLNPDTGQYDTVQMGQGIDVGENGGAEMLEPSGAALSATRDRLTDIRLQLRRQGATLEIDDARKRQLTATEAAITAQQRNAKLQKSARSLRDALEGAGADMMAFLGKPLPEGEKVGFIVNTDFSSGSFDPLFVAACADAFKNGALPLEAYLYALKHGELPDDFDAEEIALQMVAVAKAEADAQRVDPNAQNQNGNTNNAGDQTTKNQSGAPAAAAA